jgi:hypothetical protein
MMEDRVEDGWMMEYKLRMDGWMDGWMMEYELRPFNGERSSIRSK